MLTVNRCSEEANYALTTANQLNNMVNTRTHTQPFYGPFPGPPGWASARRELLDFMVQGRLTEADTLTIRLGATPSGLTSAHFHHPPIFFAGRMPFLPSNQQR